MATARFSLVKYLLATRFTSAAVTAWILGPALFISCQSPSPSFWIKCINIAMLEERRRYSAAAKLFFTFCSPARIKIPAQLRGTLRGRSLGGHAAAQHQPFVQSARPCGEYLAKNLQGIRVFVPERHRVPQNIRLWIRFGLGIHALFRRLFYFQSHHVRRV